MERKEPCHSRHVECVMSFELADNKLNVCFRSPREGEGDGEAEKIEGEEPCRSTPVECAVCSELADCNVLLEPCRHRVACEECSALMKKCIQCGSQINKRLTQGGHPLLAFEKIYFQTLS